WVKKRAGWRKPTGPSLGRKRPGRATRRRRRRRLAGSYVPSHCSIFKAEPLPLAWAAGAAKLTGDTQTRKILLLMGYYSCLAAYAYVGYRLCAFRMTP